MSSEERIHLGWGTQNLAEFVALVSSIGDEATLVERATEWIAETLEADAVVLLRSESALSATGFPRGSVPESVVAAVAAAGGGELEVPGVGTCPTCVIDLDGRPPLQLVVARGPDDPLRPDELGLLRGSARVFSAALRTRRLIEDERVLRARSERQAAENARLLHGQFHDTLSGLPNRVLFIDRLGHALARAIRSRGDIAVMVCDLDGFKAVNDSLGHAAGDDLLVQVSQRLSASVRPGDTVARLGGDEFAVLLEELAEPGDAARTARRLLGSLREPFRLGERELFLTASIGMAVGNGEAEDLLRNADVALHRAQDEGPGRYAAFEPAIHAEIAERMELEVDLKGAAQRGELVLQYQPIASLSTGAVVGVEALVRWQHPRRGILDPEQFIPAAEQSGEILDLGRWVLSEACQQAALWGPGADGARYVSVNLSGAQLADPALVQDISQTLAAAGIEPSRLMLEMTETVLMSDRDVNVTRLEALREAGVRLAIDDFGTGYSSLNYLARFPIDTLKIAKVFVDPLDASTEEPAILRAIIYLAELFGLTTVAEGVESSHQWQRLGELGCDLGQGYFRWRPTDAEELRRLLLAADDPQVATPRVAGG